jgi:carbon-monoxide dehydrogenase large subunit
MSNLTDAIPQFMGARIRRREDPALIKGQGKYVADIRLEGLLHTAILRSPYAHANIRSIDTAAAKAMEGVVAILTGAEINPQVIGALPMVVGLDDYEVKKNPPHYLLTEDKVRHVGDPVAVVVAESAYLAADALEAILVDYEPLPVVTSYEAAVAEGAPLLHENGHDNVAYKQTMGSGDVDAAFAAAETVIELTLVNQRLIPNAMEPRAVTAGYEADSDSLTVWSTTQIPHALRDDLVNMLGMPPEQVRVIAPEVGGGFGAKGNIYGE